MKWLEKFYIQRWSPNYKYLKWILNWSISSFGLVSGHRVGFFKYICRPCCMYVLISNGKFPHRTRALIFYDRVSNTCANKVLAYSIEWKMKARRSTASTRRLKATDSLFDVVPCTLHPTIFQTGGRWCAIRISKTFCIEVGGGDF